MDEQAFEARVRELTRMAEEQPARYRRGVIFWTLLGYAALSSFLLLALALLLAMVAVVGLVGVGGSLIALKLMAKGGWVLALPVLLLIKTLLSSAFVRIPPPDGVRVTAQEFPELFSTLDELAATLGVKRPDTVLVTPEFNAAVAQVPRLGVLPWFRSYLLIGLPLMQALDPVEFRAVLGHELGHLSAAHGKLGSWIYRVRSTWFRIVESLREDEEVAGSGMLFAFFGWYLPRFSAWTFVSSRANEYEADNLAAQATSADAMCRALTRVEVCARAQAAHFDHLITEMTRTTPHAPTDWYQQLGSALREAPKSNDAAGWLEDAVGTETGLADTHPSLSDRVAALGGSVELPPPPTSTAAEVLLGAAGVELLQEFSTQWKEGAQPIWAREHHKFHQEAEELAALDARLEELDEEECVRRAFLIEIHRPDEAPDLWVELYGRFPDTVAVGFRYATGRLDAGDEEGLEVLRRFAEEHDDVVIPAAQIAVGWLREQGRREEADAWVERVHAHVEAHDELQQARAQLDHTTPISPHDLDESALEYLKTVLRNTSGVGRAWVWRKELPGAPFYVVAVEIIPLADFTAEETFLMVHEGFLVPEIEAGWQLVDVKQQSRKLAKRLRSSEEAELAV